MAGGRGIIGADGKLLIRSDGTVDVCEDCCGDETYRQLMSCTGSGSGLWVSTWAVGGGVDLSYGGNCYVSRLDGFNKTAAQIPGGDTIVDADDVTIGECCELHCDSCDEFDFDATPDYYDLTITNTAAANIAPPQCTNVTGGSFRVNGIGSDIDGTYRLPLKASEDDAPFDNGSCVWELDVVDASWDFEWHGSGASNCGSPSPDTGTGYRITLTKEASQYTLLIAPTVAGGRFSSSADAETDCSATLSPSVVCVPTSFVCLLQNGVGSMSAVPGWN